MGPVPIAKVAIKVNETDSRNGPWYVESFKHDYLKIYAHRTDEAAQREVNLIIDLLNMQPGSKVLDLCCGHGRQPEWIETTWCDGKIPKLLDKVKIEVAVRDCDLSVAI